MLCKDKYYTNVIFKVFIKTKIFWHGYNEDFGREINLIQIIHILSYYSHYRKVANFRWLRSQVLMI